MAGKTVTMVKAYTLEGAAIDDKIVVVKGSAEGSCKKCDSENVSLASFIGVTQEDQDNVGNAVAVASAEILDAYADGSISDGDELVTTSAGKLQTIANSSLESAQVANVVAIAESDASDGEVVKARIVRYKKTVA